MKKKKVTLKHSGGGESSGKSKATRGTWLDRRWNTDQESSEIISWDPVRTGTTVSPDRVSSRSRRSSSRTVKMKTQVKHTAGYTFRYPILILDQRPSFSPPTYFFFIISFYWSRVDRRKDRKAVTREEEGFFSVPNIRRLKLFKFYHHQCPCESVNLFWWIISPSLVWRSR